MQYPSDAVLHFDFGETQLVCNIPVAQALACQTIKGTQNSSSFPKDTHQVTCTFDSSKLARKSKQTGVLVRSTHAAAGGRGLHSLFFEVGDQDFGG